MVSWKTVNKKLLAVIAGTGTLGVTGLFTYLFLLSGFDYTYTGDSLCDGLECSAYINVTTSYWTMCFEHTTDSQNVYIDYDGNFNRLGTLTKTKYGDIEEQYQPIVYKKSTRGRTLWANLNKVDMIIDTQPGIAVDWYFPTTKRYADHKDDMGYWRDVKDGDCWDRKKVNKNKLVGHATEGEIIKWSFIVNDVDIDPLWYSYDYVYERCATSSETREQYNQCMERCVGKEPNMIEKNESYRVPVYKNVTSERCWTNNGTASHTCRNETIVCRNNLCEYYNHSVFDHWEVKNRTVTVQDGYLCRVGAQVGNTTYSDSDGINIINETIIEWSVPVADRNFVEFPRCRDYEIIKGVCNESKITILVY